VTKVTVDSGICGFVTTVEVDRVTKHKVRVVVNSDCENVASLGESLTEIDRWTVFKRHQDSEIYQAASNCHLHITCPVPIAVLKAIEVETGLALPRDVSISFKPTGR
jgi:sorbitol-specific phosphotransferase system component IIBC